MYVNGTNKPVLEEKQKNRFRVLLGSLSREQVEIKATKKNEVGVLKLKSLLFALFFLYFSLLYEWRFYFQEYHNIGRAEAAKERRKKRKYNSIGIVAISFVSLSQVWL